MLSRDCDVSNDVMRGGLLKSGASVHLSIMKGLYYFGDELSTFPSYESIAR